MFTVNYKGLELFVEDEAYPTNRVLEFKDYNSVEMGEEYNYEMRARAKDKDGNQYLVNWIFTDVKGEEGDEYTGDWDDVDNVIEIF